MIPLLVGVFYLSESILSNSEKNLIGALIFLFASVTDWLDGLIARKFDLVSKFGAFLDPVADKLMVATALLLLVNLDRVGVLIAAIIIGREIAVSALREWMAILGDSNSVAVSFIGKLKTIFQMIAILLLIYGQNLLGIPIIEIGTYLIYLATALTLWSMFYYLRKALPLLMQR